jgi:hypothetical protein
LGKKKKSSSNLKTGNLRDYEGEISRRRSTRSLETASRGSETNRVMPFSTEESDKPDQGGKNSTKNTTWSSAIRKVRAIFGMDSMLQTTYSSQDPRSFLLLATEKLLQRRLYRLRFWSMVVSMAGLLAGIGVNEFCWRGYIPTIEEQKGHCQGVIELSEPDCITGGYTW